MPGLATSPIIEILIGLFCKINNSTLGLIISLAKAFSINLVAPEMVSPLSLIGPKIGIIALPSLSIFKVVFNSETPITENANASPESNMYKSSWKFINSVLIVLLSFLLSIFESAFVRGILKIFINT